MNTTELRPRENPRGQTIRPSMANVPRRAQGEGMNMDQEGVYFMGIHWVYS